MAEETPYPPPTAPVVAKSTTRLRRWFLGAFAIAFIGGLLFVTLYTPNIPGDAVIRCKLWRYYMIELDRAFNSPRLLGPTTGSGTRALFVLMIHVVLSAIIGFVSIGIGAVIRRSRTAREPTV